MVKFRTRQIAGVLALLAVGGCGSDPVGPIAGPPAVLTFVSTQELSGTVGELIGEERRVRLTDASGTPVPGVAIRFDILGGGGTISGDSVVTDAAGTAAPVSWRLGPAAVTNTLRAQVVGQSLVALLDVDAVAGPPSTLQIVQGGSGASALVGQSVLMTPIVRVRDSFGNPIGGAQITWRILQGGGSIIGSTTTLTNSDGRTGIAGWILGPTAGTNTIEARSANGITITVSATAIGEPAGIEAVSPMDQSGYTGFPVELTPRVRVYDEQEIPVAGVPIRFSLIGPGGTIEGVDAVTDAQGIAALGDWRLDLAGESSVQAAVTGIDLAPVIFHASGVTRPFTIDLRFLDPPSADLRDAFVAAARRWMEVILNDLPDQTINLTAPQLFGCPGGLPAVNMTVDDVVIFARIETIDGQGEVLGQASNCIRRNGTGHPVVGGMSFDIADAEHLEATNRFTDVAIHEMGHVLGLNSTNWGDHGLIAGASGFDPIYTGAEGIAGFNTLAIGYSGTPVPLETLGGQGTALHHWRETVLTTEIMTGYIEDAGVPMPLSLLTIGSLADLGYTVDPTAADPFVPTLASGLRAVPEHGTRINERILRPLWEVLPDGTLRRID